MKTLLATCLILAAITRYTRGCNEDIYRQRCSTTNTEDYLNCVTEVRKSLNCRNSCEGDDTTCYRTCDACDCDSCSDCSSYCNNCCDYCCQTRKSCRSESCCLRTCRTVNHCRSNSCRESCNKDCSTRSRYPTYNTGNYSTNNIFESKLNHTSVVHVNNFVNTTNVITTPSKTDITLNTIHPSNSWNVESSTPDNGKTMPPSTNCCRVLGPRQCVRTNTFPFVRCFHYRYETCGPICYSSIMHTYHQQQCQGSFCQQRPIYVPQPTPSCAHSQSWPYVSCGRPQGVSCEGCYGHHFGQERISCSPFCYDEGYGIGPHYRQGPFYQPWYSPVPACRVTLNCELFGNFYGYQENVYGSYVLGFNDGPFTIGMPGPFPGSSIQPENVYTVETIDVNTTSTVTPVNQTQYSTKKENVPYNMSTSDSDNERVKSRVPYQNNWLFH